VPKLEAPQLKPFTDACMARIAKTLRPRRREQTGRESFSQQITLTRPSGPVAVSFTYDPYPELCDALVVDLRQLTGTARLSAAQRRLTETTKYFLTCFLRERYEEWLNRPTTQERMTALFTTTEDAVCRRCTTGFVRRYDYFESLQVSFSRIQGGLYSAYLFMIPNLSDPNKDHMVIPSSLYVAGAAEHKQPVPRSEHRVCRHSCDSLFNPLCIGLRNILISSEPGSLSSEFGSFLREHGLAADQLQRGFTLAGLPYEQATGPDIPAKWRKSRQKRKG